VASSAKDIKMSELRDTITALRKTIATQTATIEALKSLIEANAAKEAEHLEREKVLQEQIDYLTKKLFGTSSEKRSKDIPGQLSLFDDPYIFNEAEAEVAAAPPMEEVVVREHKRKKKATLDEKLKGLPVEEILIELPEEEQVCDNCGNRLERIGKEFVRRELQYIPAKVKVIEYYTATYVCPVCKTGEDSERAFLKKASAPGPLMKHTIASPSSVAWTMYQKYANAVPLCRQEKDWSQYGIELSRATLANWIIECSNRYFRPLYEYYHRCLLKREFVMADETRIQVLNEPGRRPQTDSFVWLYRTGEDGLPAMILYTYTPTRAGRNAAEFLTGYQGYLMTDGYQGYNKVPGVKKCACWAHIRRYFVDAIPKGHEYDYSEPAVQGVQFCDKLFAIERRMKEKQYSYDKIKAVRLKEERPILDAFWSWLDRQRPILNSGMHKAVRYVQNRRAFAETYLEDGRCSFSNNLSENAIRPFTVGRKNWLFSNSVDGAEASCIVYTMVEMAKTYHLNIFGYLEFLLKNRPSSDMTDDELEKFAPWNANLALQ